MNNIDITKQFAKHKSEEKLMNKMLLIATKDARKKVSTIISWEIKLIYFRAPSCPEGKLGRET
jgi:hypothetical protein